MSCLWTAVALEVGIQQPLYTAVGCGYTGMIRCTLIENIPASQYHKFIVRQKAQYYPKHNNSVTQRQETATPQPGQGSVGDLVRGPRRGCMSLGQSGPGQGSDGDPDYTICHECCPILC